MKLLLAPVVRVLNNISWNLKFAIVGTITLVILVLLVMLSSTTQMDAWRTAQAEQQGIKTFNPALQLLLLLQQHRGMSAGALGGNAQMRGSLPAKVPEVQKAADTFMQTFAATPADWKLLEPAKDVIGQWEALRNSGLNMPGPDNFAAHTKAINDLMSLITQLDDASSLALDAESETHYSVIALTMHMPELSERLGKLRGLSNGILAAHQISDQQKAAVSMLAGELSLSWSQMRTALRYATRNTPSAQEKFKAFESQMDERINQIKRIAAEDIVGARFATTPADWWKLSTDTITLLVSETQQTYLPSLQASLDERASNARTLAFAIIVGSSLGGLLILFGLMALYASLSQGLNAIRSGTRALSNGDLTHRIHLQARDELGIVAQDFNMMGDKMESMLRTVIGNVRKLNDSANRLQTTAATVSQDAMQQSKTATAMASAIEEIARSLQSITEHSDETEKASSESRGHAESGGQMVVKVIDGMEDIANVINAAADSVRRLEERSSEITQMISSIKEIAEQTNLLALNAAIEAARAGEQGRGFAVVADEVRKLAERTTQASGQIVQTVNAVREDTMKAASAMENGVHHIHSGQELSRQSGNCMQSVCDSAVRVLEHIGEINNSLHEHGVANNMVARDVDTIARMSEHVSHEISDTAKTAADLNACANELMSSVSSFHIRG